MTEQKINTIIEAYCAKLPDELAKLSVLVRHIQSDARRDANTLKLAHAEAHRMSGAAYCMGFEQIGNLLGRLESEIDALQSGSNWEAEAAKLKVTRSWGAIGYEKPNIRPERSALVMQQAAPPTNGRRDPQRQQQEEDKTLLKGQYVLLVDDDANVRYLVRNILLLTGASGVTLAASGVEALECLNLAQPTLIISDWNMPVIDGGELLSRIRQGSTPAFSDTPVIFLTTERQQAKLRTAINLGVDYFVVKPFTQYALTKAIRSVLSRDKSNLAPPAVRRSLQGKLEEVVKEAVVSSKATGHHV